MASTSHGFNYLEDDLGQEEDGNEALPTVSTRGNEGIGSSTLTNCLKNHLGKGIPVSWPQPSLCMRSGVREPERLDKTKAFVFSCQV